MPDLHLLSPAGFQATGVYAGIKSKQTPDIGLLLCETLASAAAVFTLNQVFAAPVKVGREHIAGGKLRGIIVNSGNANACTGKQGEKDARRMCELAALVAGGEANEFLPSSTGIIGHHLPMEKVEKGIRAAGQFLGNDAEHALLFGRSILTTDLKRKSAAVEFKVGKNPARIAGVCKGSGMIGPRMGVSAVKRQAASGARLRKPTHATMLAYLTTDVQIASGLLRKLLAEASEGSFNAVTVDDQTSTNDTACILASGASEVKIATAASVRSFTTALNWVCQSLAYQIAADGEGATKVVSITVRGATTPAAAKAMARSIANSPLVKCAMHGNDPNWGRILCAAGMVGAPFDANKCTLTLQGAVVFRNGAPAVFDAALVSKALAAPEVKVDLACRIGKGSATCWTCDLSKDYVTINADYHT